MVVVNVAQMMMKMVVVVTTAALVRHHEVGGRGMAAHNIRAGRVRLDHGQGGGQQLYGVGRQLVFQLPWQLMLVVGPLITVANILQLLLLLVGLSVRRRRTLYFPSSERRLHCVTSQWPLMVQSSTVTTTAEAATTPFHMPAAGQEGAVALPL